MQTALAVELDAGIDYSRDQSVQGYVKTKNNNIGSIIIIEIRCLFWPYSDWVSVQDMINDKIDRSRAEDIIFLAPFPYYCINKQGNLQTYNQWALKLLPSKTSLNLLMDIYKHWLF